MSFPKHSSSSASSCLASAQLLTFQLGLVFYESLLLLLMTPLLVQMRKQDPITKVDELLIPPAQLRAGHRILSPELPYIHHGPGKVF